MSDAYPENRGPQFDAEPVGVGKWHGPDDDDLLEMFTRWDVNLQAHWSRWAEEARGWYDFVAGEQWSTEEVASMEENSKIPVTFNLIAPVIDAVNGAEIQDRQQVQYYPRTADMADTGISDVLTQGAEYVVDQCNGDQEDTEAFWDTLVCGIGWTETRVEVEGAVAAIIKERVDPLQLRADPSSRKRCFEDARYLKREIPMSKDEFDEFKEEIGRADIEESELGADWRGKRLTIVNPRQRYTHGMLGDASENDEVIVCEWQWWAKEEVEIGPKPAPPAEGAAAPVPGAPPAPGAPPPAAPVVKLGPLTPEEARLAKAMGQRTVKSSQRVYYRAFATAEEVLFREKLPEQSFRYKAITGKRDRNRGTYYGLVKPMVEPGKFVNKLYSEVLHIVRTNANGGMLLEEDAVSDVKEFQRTWAATDKITWMKSGALSGAHGQKMAPKSPPPVQPALFQLMEFARDMVKACTGVNEEILGLVGREQAGVLEQQRKAAAYGILSSFFDAKRRYQREQGRLLLRMMRLYLPEDFLVRIVSEGEKKYVPLAMALTAEEFDIVVDEAPASPNAKAKVAAILMPLLPQLMTAGLIGPEVVANMFQFLDLPASVAEKLQQSILDQQKQAANKPPEVVEAEAAELENLQSQTEERRAGAIGKKAKAFKDIIDAHSTNVGLGVDVLSEVGAAGEGQAPHDQPGKPAVSPGGGPPGGGEGPPPSPPGGLLEAGPPMPAGPPGEGPPPGMLPPEGMPPGA